jgi:hypothetical protein
MLIACPECVHEVSDRAPACPRCGFPIATHVAEQRAAEAATTERTTRRLTGDETDCGPCKGRGFQMIDWVDEQGATKQGFAWCVACNETGRVPIVRSSGGYFSVSLQHVEAFVRGELPTDSPHVTALGPEAPPPPSYPAGGKGSSHS